MSWCFTSRLTRRGHDHVDDGKYTPSSRAPRASTGRSAATSSARLAVPAAPASRTSSPAGPGTIASRSHARSARLILDTVADERTELPDVDGLLDMQVGGLIEERARQWGKRASRQKHDSLGLVCGDSQELSAKIHAGHLGHHEIAEDHVEAFSGDDAL
jgi:hypothetical protein